MKKIYVLGLLLFSAAVTCGQTLSRSDLGQAVTRQGADSEGSESVIWNKPGDDDVLWEQPVSTGDQTYSIASSYFNLAGWGIFAADDFELETDSEVDSLVVSGSQSAEDGASYVKGISVFIYQDLGGEPSSNPMETGEALVEITDIPISSPFVTIEPGQYPFLGDKNYFIDLDGLDKDFVLPAGTYWICIFFDLNLAENDFDIRWLWKNSELNLLNPPKVIAPVPEGDLYIPEWTNISEVGFPMTALAFSLYGDSTLMATNDPGIGDLKIFPNPATDYMHLSGKLAGEVISVSAVNMQGRQIGLDYNEGKISLSPLPAGSYVLLIRTHERTLSRKFIKK